LHAAAGLPAQNVQAYPGQVPAGQQQQLQEGPGGKPVGAEERGAFSSATEAGAAQETAQVALASRQQVLADVGTNPEAPIDQGVAASPSFLLTGLFSVLLWLSQMLQHCHNCSVFSTQHLWLPHMLQRRPPFLRELHLQAGRLRLRCSSMGRMRRWMRPVLTRRRAARPGQRATAVFRRGLPSC
jgi:hypothetical protein